MVRRERKWVRLSLVLMSFLLLVLCSEGLALGASHVPIGQDEDDSSHAPNTPMVLSRDQAGSKISPPEPVDAVLIRSKEWKWNRYLHGVLNLPKWIDMGFENRTRFEVYDHPWRVVQPLGQTDPQVQLRSRIRLGLNGRLFRFLFEGQDSRVFLDGSDSFVNSGSRNETDILQLLVSATSKSIFGTGLRSDLHVGRLTMDFGHRRLIARNDFRNTTNSFDGGHWQLARHKNWRVRAFLVQPVVRNILTGRLDLDESSADFVFWGVYGENNQVSWLRINGYYFGLNDQRASNVNVQRTYSTLGLRLHEQPQQSQIDYEVETVWQTGKLGNADHFAHFQHVDLGYTFAFPWSPRLLIYYDYASGDRDPMDSQSSGFDTLFGARRFEYAPTGNFGPFFRRNISSPGWRVIMDPFKNWKFQVKQRVWFLATSRGFFDGSGLRDPTGGSGNYLGHDLELRAQWKINDNLEFDAGWDHWFKGSYFERLPASAGLPPGGEKDTDYFYIFTKFRV